MGVLVMALLGIAALRPPLSSAQQASAAVRPEEGIVAQWDFSEAAQGYALERISGGRDRIAGNVETTASPVGTAVSMDGYTAAIRRAPLAVLSRAGDISITCWLQLNAYPWNEAPILDQNGPGRGVFFGVDAEGHLLGASGGGAVTGPVTITSDAVPLRLWTMVAMTMASDGQVALSIGGQGVATPSNSKVLLGGVILLIPIVFSRVLRTTTSALESPSTKAPSRPSAPSTVCDPSFHLSVSTCPA